MYNFSIPMALADYIPVVFFAVTMVVLLRDLHSTAGRGCYALLAAGCINVFTAGFLKATWKLLYAANICDFTALEEMFLPVNSLGLLLVGLSLLGMVCRRRKDALVLAAPPVFGGSFLFIMMMVVGLGGMCAALSTLAARLKKKKAIVLFAASFICAMGMGYMSSQDSTQAWVNWTEQSINCISQLFLMLGVIVLHKNGLEERSREEKAV